MGKEWLYWSGGSNSTTTTGSRKGGRAWGEDRDQAPPSGCMCSVFQLFNLHRFQLPLNHQSSFKPDFFITEEPKNLEGVEAPKNSLELEEPFILMEAGSLSSTVKEEEHLNIPVGIQIKTGDESKSSRACGSQVRRDELASECCISPVTKTPNLVARLMGLDLLPEGSRPSSSYLSTSNPISNSHFHPQVQSMKKLTQSRSSRIRSVLDNEIMGTRSLPETPRMSSARRSDVDCHRLSLQINKENIGVSQELEISSYLSTKTARRRDLKHEDDNRSPRHHARQVVKQVKERVSRKVGIDITNTIRNRRQARDDTILLLKSKKPAKQFTSAGDESTPSCSPRLRFLESRNKPVMQASTGKNQTSQSSKLSSSSPSSSSNGTQPQSAKVPSSPKTEVLPLQEQKHQQQRYSVQKSKKISSNQRYSPRFKTPPQTCDVIRKKQEEPFVRSSTINKSNPLDRKNKKTPLSNDLLNSNLPTLLPVRKDPSPPATKLPHQQVEKQSQVSDALPSKKNTRLPSCWSQSYKQESTHTSTLPEISDDGTEFQYISRILRETGIERDKPVSFTNWYSQSHPLDPSFFHYLELFHSPNFFIGNDEDFKLSHRCNRKLMFNLVDELLVDILRPYMNLKPWVCFTFTKHEFQMHGAELIDNLWSRIRNFPSADCRVLEDIDALIDKDLCRTDFRVLSIPCEEESEGVVKEIEREILDDLMHETAVVMVRMPYLHHRKNIKFAK